MTDYALLAPSGCYRLPAGVFSDDASAMTELQIAMRTLGFKSKHAASIFSLLIAILELRNLQFTEGVSREDTAHVANLMVLEHTMTLLSMTLDDLVQVLTTKTSYVWHELFTILLSPERSAIQRDHLMQDLHAILFASVVETANHKLTPSPDDPAPHAQITLLDQPGYQSNSIALTLHAPLIAAYGQNGFKEFTINFAAELLHSYVVRNTFEDGVGYNAHVTGDGVALPAISTMDNVGCVGSLRGSQLSEQAHRKPGGMLGVMCRSSDPFVAKLFSGLNLATESHHQDPSIVVQAQVSTRSLHEPTQLSSTRALPSSLEELNQLDASKMYPITTQINRTLSELLTRLNKSHLWAVSCIRLNDSGSPNLFDKRRVKAQVWSLLLPDTVARKKKDCVVDYDQVEFCDWYVPTMMGETPLQIRQCVQKNGIVEGRDYVLGHRMIFLTYVAWKLVKDGVQEVEMDRKMSMAEDDESVMPDDAATEHMHDAGLMLQLGYFLESADNLLLTRNASGATNDLNGITNAGNLGGGGYGNGGLNTPRVDKVPAPYAEQDAASGWSEWDKASGIKSPIVLEKSKESADGLVVNNAPNTVEEIPTS